MTTHPLPIFVQRFFTERLANQLAASPNTVASYRDTFRLLLTFATDCLSRQPTDLLVTDIDAELVGRFLDFVETSRGNSARSRNIRLAAIRSFFKYVAINEPGLLHHCQRVLALPSKRYQKRMIDYLDREQIEALLAAPDLSTWYGRRDRALLHLCVQTGLRVSELIDLRCGDVVLGTGAHVRCRGKGRKDRSTPLRADTVAVLGAWLDERADTADRPLFVSNRNGRLSRDAVERIVQKYVALASERCPTLKGKHVSPHCLRHTAAMALLHKGVGCTVIALWLGHESVETTQIYLHADLQVKEKAMQRTKPVDTPPGRYRPSDALLDYLERL
jgi:integrase/recombinase XerD